MPFLSNITTCILRIATIGCLSLSLSAQSLLQKPLYLEVRNVRMDKCLENIQKQGYFYFSYNTRLFRQDSLISLSIQGGTVSKPWIYCLGGN